MRRDEVFCPCCGEPFPIGLIELSRAHHTPKCWWCIELENLRNRASMKLGEIYPEQKMYQEIAKRIASFASKEGKKVSLVFEQA